MLVIQEIYSCNFVGHRERRLTLPKAGITLITGANGIGKSSFIEAVAVGFWGHTLRGTTPWREGVPGKVEVTTPDLVVRRGVGKSGTNALNFTRDGKLVKGDSPAKCQKELEQYIPDIDVWRWSSLLSNTDAASFSLATDAQRKALIEDMLAMPSTDQAVKDTRAAIKALRTQLAEANTKGAVLKERLAGEQRRLKETSALGSPTPSEDLDTIIAEGKAAAECAKVLQTEVEALRRKASELAVKGATGASNLGHLEGRVRACSRAECPTCGQGIPHELAASVKAELAEAVAARRALEAEVNAERAAVDRDLRTKQTELDKATRARDDARVRYQAQQGARQQAAAAEGIKAKATAAIADTEAQLAQVAAQVQALSLEIKHEEAVEEVLGTRGARTHLLSSTLAAVAEVANGWLKRLAGPHFRLTLRSYSETSRGELTNKISMEVEGAGGGHGYKASSGGERKRIDIAVMLGLGDIARRLRGESGSTLFFDEAFDALDEQGLAAVVDVLRELSQDRAVVVVSHSTTLIDLLRPHARRVHLD